MNVVQEKVDKLNAILKVQIQADDYQSKVKSTLEIIEKRPKFLVLDRVTYLWV